MEWRLDAEHPVVFFINGIGDNILNLPALRALAQVFEGRLTLISSGREALQIFNELPLRRLVSIPVNKTDNGREFDTKNAAGLTGDCDLFIALVPWCTSSLIQLIKELRPALSVGFFSNYDIRIPLDFDKHSAELAFDAVRLFNPSYCLRDFTAPPSYRSEALAEAESLISSLGPGTRVLAAHADTIPEKMWVPDRFIETLDIFLDLHKDYAALLIGSRPQGLDSGRYGDRVIPCYGLPLSISQSLVAKADRFLGVDSCMLHVADFARVPGVGLFGPTRAEEFGFLVGPNVTIQAQGQMEQIEVGEVCAALDSIIANPKQSTTWDVAEGSVAQVPVAG
ncbi:MAG TPA: glycosyltransferase family 9 protein [Blastocatellia bacterium]|nr:glycosyltransferase family 9 protein [Blastocatellia bacterium]